MRSAIVITASNRAVAGVYKDLSGGALKIGLENLGYQVLGHKLVQDDMHQIATTIRSAIEEEIDLIITTGGTGISPSDVTPEATKPEQTTVHIDMDKASREERLTAPYRGTCLRCSKPYGYSGKNPGYCPDCLKAMKRRGEEAVKPVQKKKKKVK